MSSLPSPPSAPSSKDGFRPGMRGGFDGSFGGVPRRERRGSGCVALDGPNADQIVPKVWRVPARGSFIFPFLGELFSLPAVYVPSPEIPVSPSV